MSVIQRAIIPSPTSEVDRFAPFLATTRRSRQHPEAHSEMEWSTSVTPKPPQSSEGSASAQLIGTAYDTNQ